MDNRRLSPGAVSRASALSQSTILQLLHGKIQPSPETMKDIAPALQISEADLLTIANLAAKPTSTPPRSYRNAKEIGELVSIASRLADEDLRRLIDFARALGSEES
ncbi:helix-turn-helix transcriptional regulator [Streptomyces sp. LBUM 1476]|nr:helix-turn-helix transcriptional regulator [Streptomyces sp. LBUM 1476]